MLKRMHESEIIFTILRDLPLDTPFETLYDLPGTTAKDIIQKRCRADVHLIGSYIQKWESLDCLPSRHAHMCMLVLTPMLDDPAVHSVFTAACMIVSQSTVSIKVMGYLLQGVQAFAWALRKTIPESAQPYLQGCGAEETVADLPLAFALPQQDDLKRAFASDGQLDLQEMEDKLEAFIEQWARVGQ